MASASNWLFIELIKGMETIIALLGLWEDSLTPFRRSAKSLRGDFAAVKPQRLYPPWSTSPVEGHVNRLKMLKRETYARTRLDLLAQ